MKKEIFQSDLNAIILAAGQGKRLASLTKNKPKCMINLFGKTLLEWQVSVFKKCGIFGNFSLKKSAPKEFQNTNFCEDRAGANFQRPLQKGNESARFILVQQSRVKRNENQFPFDGDIARKNMLIFQFPHLTTEPSISEKFLEQISHSSDLF